MEACMERYFLDSFSACCELDCCAVLSPPVYTGGHSTWTRHMDMSMSGYVPHSASKYKR